MAKRSYSTANTGSRSSALSQGVKVITEPTRGPRSASNRPTGERMSDQNVVGFLGRMIDDAMNMEDGDISDDREENFNYFIGAEYGNEREGYSKFVTREALETVEWVLPSVLRVFLSGDKIVTFDPQNPNDEGAADQETDVTNYFAMRANNGGYGGFLPLHHWIKDCLMYPNGYLKCYMDERDHTDVGTLSGLTDVGVQMLVDDPEVEILEQRSRTIWIDPSEAAPAGPPPGMPPAGAAPGAPGPQGAPQPPPGPAPQGAPQMPPGGMGGPETQPPGPAPVMGMPPEPVKLPQEVFDLKIRTTHRVMELKLAAVPPEEALVHRECTSTNLDEAQFVAHRVRKAYSELVNEGYDPDELDQIGGADNYQWNDERVNRLFWEDEDPDDYTEVDPSMRLFWVHECYAWFDYEGTGVAQFRRVILIGDQIFENEETNYQPLIAMSAILMAHKHNGMGYVDIMKDLQLLQSVLTRQLLDNVYKINVRRKVFSEDALTEDGATMEAILNTQAEFIPVRGPAANAFVPEPTQSIIGELLPVIQHFQQQTTVRTGVSPESQVDPNALQEVRQDVYSNAMDRASQRIEMLVRIFAETGFRQLMLKVHQLLRMHWDTKRTIKLRGEWIDVDPQGWRDRTDMSVNVGLGFHTKQQQLGLMTQLLAMQKEAAGQGLSNLDKVYNGLEKMVNASGLGDTRQFFIDPKSPEFQPPEPPPPDPNMILAQAQAEALQAESQRKQQELQLKAQTEGQTKMVEAKIKEAELQMKQIDQQIKLRELDLKEREMREQGELAVGELAVKVKNTEADTQLKQAQADKAMADAASVAVEASETYQKAVEMVSQSAELNDGGEIEIEAEDDDDGGERPTETETE